MSKTLKITLITVAVLFGAAILVTSGVVLGRTFAYRSSNSNNRFNESRQPFNMGSGMAGRWFSQQGITGNQPFRMGPGMMGRGFFGQGNDDQGYYRQGQGMMGRSFFGQGNDDQESFKQGQGMMGRKFFNSAYAGEAASIEEARIEFESYLTNIANDDLELHEIMIFNQNAYAVVAEKSTGKGAMELLLDFASGDVYPEFGPNHMWNLKYGMMSGGRNDSFVCGMGSTVNSDSTTGTEMTVTEVNAKTAAQAFLDANEPGATAADEGMAFYGYYTFDYSLDGKIAGMLSVNGYNSQIWLHTWHGQFVDEWELE